SLGAVRIPSHTVVGAAVEEPVREADGASYIRAGYRVANDTGVDFVHKGHHVEGCPAISNSRGAIGVIGVVVVAAGAQLGAISPVAVGNRRHAVVAVIAAVTVNTGSQSGIAGGVTRYRSAGTVHIGDGGEKLTLAAGYANAVGGACVPS